MVIRQCIVNNINEKNINKFLIERLNHNNPLVRRNAALEIENQGILIAITPLLSTYFPGSSYIIPRIIGKIGKKNIKLLLKIAMNNYNGTRMRQYAIEGLGKIGDKKILNNLYLLLKSDDVYIRKSCILALGDIRDKNSAGKLLYLLDIEVDWIKPYIIWSLGKLGDLNCLNKLIEMLSIKNLNFITKKIIIKALGWIGDKRAVKKLIELLNEKNSGLEDYILFALENIGDTKVLPILIKNYLKPIWFLKEHNKCIINKLSPQWRNLLNNYDLKIYNREDLPPHFYTNINNEDDWFYGCLNKSHYILNSQKKIIGCLNLIYLINYEKVILFYMDTIEIKEEFRRQKIGTELVNQVINEIKKKFERFNIFLLVAKCKQYKLKFFSTLGFIPIKLRKTGVGAHCIMSYPFTEDSERNCKRLFEYFCWREEKKEIISSDCKYAYNPNPTGLYWCKKKMIYVTGLEKKKCPFYIKEKEIISEKKFFDLKEFF